MTPAMASVRVKKVFLDKSTEELEPEACPECLRINQNSYLRYFHISLDESIYKCGDSKCMYPFANFKYKRSQDQSVYRYQQIEQKPQSPTKSGNISLDIDWLDGNSSLYDTVRASDAVAEEYSLNDSSVLTNFLNLSDDNVLDNYNINEFIDNICNERCDDEVAEQYIITELLKPCAASSPALKLPLQMPLSSPILEQPPLQTIPQSPQISPKSTIPVAAKVTTPKLTKCLRFISEQQLSSVATVTPYHRKSPKRLRKKVKRLRDPSDAITTSKPTANETTIPKTGNPLKEENIAVPTAQAVRNLLDNHKNYRPLHWIQSLQAITSKHIKPEPVLQVIVRPFKGNIKKEKVKREVKVKKEVHYEANEGDELLMGFTKKSLNRSRIHLNNLSKVSMKLNAMKSTEIKEFYK